MGISSSNNPLNPRPETLRKAAEVNSFKSEHVTRPKKGPEARRFINNSPLAARSELKISTFFPSLPRVVSSTLGQGQKTIKGFRVRGRITHVKSESFHVGFPDILEFQGFELFGFNVACGHWLGAEMIWVRS